MGLFEDFKTLADVLSSIQGDAGPQGQQIVSELSSGISNAIARVQDVDLALLDDATATEMLRVLE